MSYYFTVTWYEHVQDSDDAEPRPVCFARRYDVVSWAEAQRLRDHIGSNFLETLPDAALLTPGHYGPLVSDAYPFGAMHWKPEERP